MHFFKIYLTHCGVDICPKPLLYLKTGSSWSVIYFEIDIILFAFHFCAFFILCKAQLLSFSFYFIILGTLWERNHATSTCVRDNVVYVLKVHKSQRCQYKSSGQSSQCCECSEAMLCTTLSMKSPQHLLEQMIRPIIF